MSYTSSEEEEELVAVQEDQSFLSPGDKPIVQTSPLHSPYEPIQIPKWDSGSLSKKSSEELTREATDTAIEEDEGSRESTEPSSKEKSIEPVSY